MLIIISMYERRAHNRNADFHAAGLHVVSMNMCIQCGMFIVD